MRTLRRSFRSLSATLTLVIATAAVGPAFADVSPADKETARTLMTDGRAKREQGDHKTALDDFQRADSIMHVPTTGLEVGREHEALGQLIEAREAWLAVARLPVDPKEPKPFAEARKEAEQLAEAIVARIPTLKLIVTGLPPNAIPKLTIDELEVSSATIGVPRKIDPGTHSIEVGAGTASKKDSVELKEGEAKELTLAFTPEDLSGAGPIQTNEAPPPPEEHPAEGPPPSKRSPLTYVGFGLAGVGIVVGSITGLMSMSKTSTAKQSCVNNQCPRSVHSDLDSAHSLATISTISFIAAGVGAGVGLIGLLVSKHPAADAEPAAATAHVEPMIGVGFVGIQGAF